MSLVVVQIPDDGQEHSDGSEEYQMQRWEMLDERGSGRVPNAPKKGEQKQEQEQGRTMGWKCATDEGR